MDNMLRGSFLLTISQVIMVRYILLLFHLMESCMLQALKMVSYLICFIKKTISLDLLTSILLFFSNTLMRFDILGTIRLWQTTPKNYGLWRYDA
jgi:hypothetical protein